MQLWFNKGSPFARKVRILVREKGLEGRIEEIDTTVSPVGENAALATLNPLIKIPVLVLDNEEPLADSRVICEYLDTQHAGTPSLPIAGLERFAALRDLALADGILDAAVLCRYEYALRPRELRWDGWIAGQKRKIEAGLQALDSRVDSWKSEVFSMEQIAVICALGYLDFRFGAWEWRAENPRLADWYARMAERASVKATVPT